jgi:hypothetical protein
LEENLTNRLLALIKASARIVTFNWVGKQEVISFFQAA